MSRQQERAQQRKARQERLHGRAPIPTGGIALDSKPALKDFAQTPAEIELLGDLVMMREIRQDQTEGGIVLPEGHHDEGPRRGVVVNVGPGLMKEDDSYSPMNCKVGDLVYMQFTRQTLAMQIAGEPHFIVPDSAILMKVRKGGTDSPVVTD